MLVACSARGSLINVTPGGWHYADHGNVGPAVINDILYSENHHQLEFFDEARPGGWISRYGTLNGGVYFFTDLISQEESTALVSWNFAGLPGYSMLWLDVFGFNNGDPWESVYRVPWSLRIDSDGWQPVTLDGNVLISSISFYGQSPNSVVPEGGNTLYMAMLAYILISWIAFAVSHWRPRRKLIVVAALLGLGLASNAPACDTHFWLVRWANTHHKPEALADEALFLKNNPKIAERLDKKCMKARKHPKRHRDETPTPTPVPTATSTPRPTSSPTPTPPSSPTPTPTPIPTGCVMGPGCWVMNQEDWCADTYQLGANLYSKQQVVEILQNANRPNGLQNGLIPLAKELASTKIAFACNSDQSCIIGVVQSADLLIGARVIPPIGDGFLTMAQVQNLVFFLRQYNQGKLCAPICEE